MGKNVDLSMDGGLEEWKTLLRELEERCERITAGIEEAPGGDDPWCNEQGEPIDPIAFFVTFTGLE